MNTEPPEGDDLQRMLVSMKQNVLERATAHPKRRRARPGVVIGIVGLLAIGTATGAVALSLSQSDEPVAAPAQTQQPEPAPTATTPTSAPITASPTPLLEASPSATSVTSKRIPGLCSQLVPTSDYLRFFGAARLETFVYRPDGTRDADGNDRIQGLRDPEESLYCSWQNEGVLAQLTITVQRTKPASAEVPLDEGEPVTCTDRLGGTVCSFVSPNTETGTPVTVTSIERDDLLITISQFDFPTNGLLDAVVGEIWGD